ncbi:MAG: hypothetical protein K2N47_00080 [Clostridia bacterium]|nr:hypothetical protein [Clostridia bacterium]
MSNTQLIELKDGGGCPFLFFDDARFEKFTYQIYNDGGHYIANRVLRPLSSYRQVMRKLKRGEYKAGLKKTEKRTGRDAEDILFDSLYNKACADGLKDGKIDKPMTEFIREGILRIFPQFDDLDEYIARKIKGKANNLHHRKKLFKRKASLNRWNYFVTFTYADKKQTEDSFKKKLRKCLANLHTRRGWKYMGVFERAPETGRLHFHGLLYVTYNEMLGTITEKQDYSTTDGKMQTRHENSFFENAFGRNDFDEVTDEEMKNGLRQEYILKYIGKTGERIVYSRGIPSMVLKHLTVADVVTPLRNDFGDKYILFDDIIDWERDIMRCRYNKQMTVIDLLCNPPSAA